MSTETLVNYGKLAGAIMIILGFFKVIWNGLKALLHAQAMVADMQRQVENMERLQTDMAACLQQAKSLNRDMDKTEKRLEKLEDRVWEGQH